MLGTVGEEPVDDHADDGEKEDDQTPEKLVRRGTVRLEDLDCKQKVVSVDCTEEDEKDDAWSYVLKTMISRIRTMKPITPPPVPYCHELPAVEAVTS